MEGTVAVGVGSKGCLVLLGRHVDPINGLLNSAFMASAVISALALELRRAPEPLRRLEVIRALGLLMCLPSEQAEAPLILQILLDDLEAEPTYLRIGAETLQAVTKVSRHSDSINGPRLITDLLNAWPKLFHWIWIRASPLDLPPTDPANSVVNSDYVSATINVLSLYSTHLALFRMSAENEGTPVDLLVTRLWYWKAKGIDTSIPSSIFPLCRTYLNANSSTPDCQCLTLGVAASMPSLVASKPEWIAIQDITLINHSISSTIGLLLCSPSAEFTAPSPDINSIEAHLGMIVALSRAPRHQYAFINHHSPSIAAKTLISLSNLPASASDMTLVAKCISLCVEHLCIILEASAGFETILEVLDAMLLPVLIKCYAHIPQLNTLVPTEHDAASLLTTVLSKYLIYISARERVSKSLAIIAANGSEFLLLEKSPFAVAWSNFKALAIQRMQIQERRVRLKNEIICSNIMVWNSFHL
jgi:hypothetical protein